MLPTPEDIQRAEAYLLAKGWAEHPGICTSKYWQHPSNPLIQSTVHAIGLQAIQDLSDAPKTDPPEES